MATSSQSSKPKNNEERSSNSKIPCLTPPAIPPKGYNKTGSLSSVGTGEGSYCQVSKSKSYPLAMHSHYSKDSSSSSSPQSPVSPSQGFPPPLPIPRAYPSPNAATRTPTSKSSNITFKAQIEPIKNDKLTSWPVNRANEKTLHAEEGVSYSQTAENLAPVENLIKSTEINQMHRNEMNYNTVNDGHKNFSHCNPIMYHNTIATDKIFTLTSKKMNDQGLKAESFYNGAGNVDSITDVSAAGKPLSRQPSLSRSRSDEALAPYRLKKEYAAKEYFPAEDNQSQEHFASSLEGKSTTNDGVTRKAAAGNSGNRSPGSSSVTSLMSSATVVTQTGAAPLDSPIVKGTQKHTLGEILKHIDLKSAAVLNQTNFTHATTLPDLTFLAHQSRYSADPQIKRRLISRLSESHVVEIFIKVFNSVHTVDYLKILDTPFAADGTQSANAIQSDVVSSTSAAGKGSNWGVPPPHPDSSHSYVTNSPKSVSSPRQRPVDMMSEPGVDNRSLLSERLHNVPNSMKNLRAALTLIVNTSEKSNAVCDDCLRSGVVAMLFLELSDHQFHGSEAVRDQNRMYLVKGYLGILLNIIKHHPDARDAFREAGAVKVLQQYLKSSLLMVKTRTLLLLSYVIGEAENDVINSSERHLSFLVKMLQGAIDVTGHFSKKYGMHAAEIAAAINRYASCDSNKTRLIRRGVLPLYTQLMKPPSSEEEQMLGAKGLWSLAFSEENRTVIQQDQPCLKALQCLESSSHREEIRKTASGALWVIHEHHIPVRPITTAFSDQVPDIEQHVLISYQWGAKSLVFKIKERLRAAGYKVCTDVENTDISIMEGMAAACAQAAVVLICMTHRFKDSPSCRTEAEYAWHGGRPLIPLKLQQHYSPEGWLLPLVDSRMTFDLSTEENLDTLLPNLVREIGNRGRFRVVEQFDVLLGGSSSSLPKPQDAWTQTVDMKLSVAHWTCGEVTRWLRHHDLTNITDKLKHVDGELLLEIRKMQKDAPESFYSTLKNELKMNFLLVLKFTKALDTLDYFY